MIRHSSGCVAAGLVAGVWLAASAIPASAQIQVPIGVQFDEVMAGANGDSAVQFIEIKALLGSNHWGPSFGSDSRAKLVFFDATGTRTSVFNFPHDPMQIPGTQDPNTPNLFSVLIGTPGFELASGVEPDFEIKPAVLARAGKVCFLFKPALGNQSFTLCVSYGSKDPDIDVENGLIPFVGADMGEGTPADPLPITDSEALQRFQDFGCVSQICHENADFALLPPAPRNSLGETGTIVVAATTKQGFNLFFRETFQGNGRSCVNCHLPQDGFGLRPETIAGLPDNDPLFVAEFIPGLEELENPCLMRRGNQRALILENVHGFAADPVFRASPHLMNIEATGPYGWSPTFGGADNLRDFCAGAIKQHFPRLLPRNFDPRDGKMSQRTGTADELTFMEDFQNTIKTVVRDGQGPLTDDREENLDRLIAEFLRCNPDVDPDPIDDGRTAFFSVGCSNCHSGPFLGDDIARATGVVDHPGNDDTGCGGALPDENVACDNNPACNPPMRFDTRPLVDVARVRSGIGAFDPELGGFFHDNVVRTLRGSVAFYNAPPFPNPLGMTEQEIDDITAFMEAIVQVECP